MTKNNFQKKQIRERMVNTGEVFSVAKRNLSSSKHTVLFSPWNSLNQIVGGFHSGRLYVFASKPEDGEITLGTHLAAHFASTKTKVLYVNDHLNRKGVVARISATLTGFPFSAILDGTLNSEDDTVLREMKRELTGNIVVHINQNLPYLEDFSPATFNDESFKAVIVDLVNIEFGQKESFVAELKQLALRLNIPVVFITKLRENVTSEDFSDSNLTQTGIQSTANIVGVLGYDSVHDNIKLHLVKNRDGNHGVVSFLPIGETGRLVENISAL